MLGECRVPVQFARGCDGGGPEKADQLVIHRRSGGGGALLGRVRRGGEQPAGFSVAHKVIDEEERGLSQGGVGALGEEFAVTGEEPALPEMMAKPGAAGRPQAVDVIDRGGAAPEVEVVVEHPAA